MATKLDEVSATLSFVPNDFYASLDLAALDAPKDGVDVGLIALIGGIALAVGGAATASVLIVIRKKRSNALMPAKKK